MAYAFSLFEQEIVFLFDINTNKPSDNVVTSEFNLDDLSQEELMEFLNDNIDLFDDVDDNAQNQTKPQQESIVYNVESNRNVNNDDDYNMDDDNNIHTIYSSLEEIRNHCKKEVERQWDEVKRFDNPHEYYVDLSQKLWDVKHDMLKSENKNK